MFPVGCDFVFWSVLEVSCSFSPSFLSLSSTISSSADPTEMADLRSPNEFETEACVDESVSDFMGILFCGLVAVG